MRVVITIETEVPGNIGAEIVKFGQKVKRLEKQFPGADVAWKEQVEG